MKRLPNSQPTTTQKQKEKNIEVKEIFINIKKLKKKKNTHKQGKE